MAYHSFSATILNLSTQQLTLQSSPCDHGEFTLGYGADQTIQPISASFCRTESTPFSAGDQATLNYTTESGQQIQISWHDGGSFSSTLEITSSPEYSPNQTPPSSQTLSVAHTTDIADGAHLSVVFVIYPTPTIPQLPYLQNTPAPATVNPLGGCDLVLAVSEQAINNQLSDLSFLGVIDRSWNYKGTFGYFNAMIDHPTVSITKGSVSNGSLQLSILFTSGNLVLTTSSSPQPYDMSNWKLVFDVTYSTISFSSSQISEIVHPKLVAIVQKNLTQVASGSGIPDSEFTIQQLFLDMMNADVANYNQQASYIPLPTSDQQMAFAFLIASYVKNFPNNAYVLG